MAKRMTLQYWIDDGWYVGRLNEVPGVFSQGESPGELERNIRDAYRMMLREEAALPVRRAKTKEIEVSA
ncbi:MAG: type II toxin-antitoxin system HicB family antitoxin [Planctomycetes bacterium]|nr:type II toxin-antitoxin system HicB family antitoxin [Planctomycetota bacterium]